MRPYQSVALAIGIVLIALGVTACGEDPLESAPLPAATRSIESASLELPTIDIEGNPQAIQMVVGNGHLIEGETRRTSTFNIYRLPDGTVGGWYHALRRGPGGAHVRVLIDCLHIVGNEAWASGTVVSAANPENVGRPYALRFVDHGEGVDAVPDEIGVGRFADYDCESEPEIGLRSLTVGNLRVVE